ncbi:response regulator receiver domain-containing protein [Pontibacter ummariensis]|uniref:Response regulator receiver domain-containing protein n=1 Tax=Pontibacter ummariensis TaxID=1610492 RepID=A0A239J7G0_9BACT|nr:response regulator [Pontibacter ummariensis]PRY08894.1 response regulator receiver domain-containing protein [Pontibacter ummariensis]SNT01183.1 Response regulator receiver domain-containing protein [Pontibacter ummariensis]
MAESKTILIAEDSSVILNLTKKILELQNYKILVAKNGGEVIKQVESNKIDAILMDLNIPVKNGMDCTREIRAHKDKDIANIPIIAVTGNANNYSMEDFKEAGVNDYLPKPLDFDLLVETVKKYTGK